MSLPALDDIAAHRGVDEPIEGLVRIETAPLEQTAAMFMAKVRSVYPHDEIFGSYCTVHGYIDCPPDELFGYMSDARSLEEWSYTLRDFAPAAEPGLWLASDRLLPDTEIYTRVVANADARTVDYYCAWDQGAHLWMVYLMRVVDAERVLQRPGSVVLWTNCRHPFYDRNPYPHAAPRGRTGWVGDFWDAFAAGHALELNNLKVITEYRHHNGLPVTPEWMR